jgi:hypothetical protein
MWAALSITFCVGLEGALAFALLSALVRGSPLRRLAGPFAAAIVAGLAVGAGVLLLAASRGLAAGDVAPSLQRVRHLHAIALVALAVLARGRGVEDLAAGRRRALAELGALAAALGVLLPEGAFLAVQLRDLAILAGAALPVWLGATAGLLAAAAAGALLAALAGRLRLGAALTPASVLFAVFALELAGVAARAVDAHVLPLALTSAVSVAMHDAVHLVFVMLQVPDHAYLEDSIYQLILRFLEPALHAAVAATVLAAPMVVAWRAFARRPRPELPPAARAPERRSARAAFLRASRAGAVPFAAAVLLSAAVIWQARGGVDELYEPVPEPVVDDGAGTIVVPLAGPLGGGDRMRKWVYSANGRTVTFFGVRRPDGVLAVALDLCEICQPKGYAQMGRGHVFCKYCKTPIPIATVGQPGGCNPVPIPGAEVKGAMLLIPRAALLAAFEKAMVDKR